MRKKCLDCANSAHRIVMGGKTKGNVCKIDLYLVHEVNPYGYCDCFKPKEEEAKCTVLLLQCSQ